MVLNDADELDGRIISFVDSERDGDSMGVLCFAFLGDDFGVDGWLVCFCNDLNMDVALFDTRVLACVLGVALEATLFDCLDAASTTGELFVFALYRGDGAAGS